MLTARQIEGEPCGAVLDVAFIESVDAYVLAFLL